MAMSQKHYREAAEVIRTEVQFARTEQGTVAGAASVDALRSVAVGLANMFKVDNPAFNRRKFMEAAGLE